MSSKTKAAPTVDRVDHFYRRIDLLLEEKQTLGNDVREVYDEAKKEGINTTALRKVIARRRAKTPDPAIAAAMEAYEHALDQAALMVSNGSTSLRKAARETGFSKSAIQRQVSHRNENADGGTPHDPTTGEITETPGLSPAAGAAGTAVEGGLGSSPASIAETGRGIDALSPDCGDPAREIGGPPDVVGPMDAVTPPQQPEDTAPPQTCNDPLQVPAVKESLTADPPPCDVSLRNIRDGLRELAAVGEEIAAKLEAPPQEPPADPWDAVGPLPAGLKRVKA